MKTYLSTAYIRRKSLAVALLCAAATSAWGQTGNTMQNPIVVGTYSAGFQYTNSQNIANFTNTYTARAANDIFYKFTLTKSMSVVMSHCGSAVDTYLHLLDASGNRIDYNDDYSGEGACSSNLHSYLKKNLAAGTYYVVSETYSATSGVIQTTIKGFVGDNMQAPIDVGTFSAGFQYTNSQNIANFTNTYTARTANDIFYKFTLTKSMSVVMSHCGSAVDTYLHLLDASGNRIDYNDDYSGEGACSSTLHSYLKKNLAAGTYYVVSETYSATSGVIQTTIKGIVGDNMQAPIDVGTFSAGFQYTNSQNIENFTNSYTGRSTNDIFYKFTLTKSMSVVINHCGSAVDTYLHLLDASGNRIDYNDDYSGEGACSSTLHSYLKKNWRQAPTMWYRKPTTRQVG
ncbi:MAG: pre-peptidase C-terminal domain-containing protein [Prevotellaceae bacterium]|jgi:hypothetical protein|nr:pre-peptidase C-terminal domain-containing protein [Prevotellaceae bacterium]